MNNIKIGNLIYTLRKEKQLTQLQLAERMNISDKTVSKWERGLGCPDISLLPDLSKILEVNLEELLSGKLDINSITGGNMKKTKFYICPQCGNIITSSEDAAISCCGKKLSASEPQKANEQEKLSIENIETDYFISTNHEMTKEHYISFVALFNWRQSDNKKTVSGMELANTHSGFFLMENLYGTVQSTVYFIRLFKFHIF